MKKVVKTVGLLATGSELISGEILNTNGQTISQILFSLGVHLGEQLMVDDQESNICAGIEFLAGRHSAVIITGGLGPTSDDRTRFALTSFLNLPLIFNVESWERIEKRFALRDRVPTENNRIQSLFSEGAQVLPNPNGTADGAMIEREFQGTKQLFFLLPGPPLECLPLFENHVLPILKSHQYFSENRLYRWTLMDVSESVIASKLDPFAEKYGIEIAYRAAKPALHIKVILHPDHPIDHWIKEIENLLLPHAFERNFPL